MATGYQHGATCHASIQQAAAAACATAGGAISGGYQSCGGFSVAGSAATLNLSATSPVGAQSYSAFVQFQPCEYPTWSDTYLPIVAAALPFLAVIFIGKKLISIFNTDASAA